MRTDAEIDAVFASLPGMHADALYVSVNPLFTFHAAKIVAHAARLAIPAVYYRREFADAGGLLSYGTDAKENYRVLGDYAGRILKGEKAGDLPVQQSTRFELVINLKTAKALGLTVPPTLLAIADEVIE
jgi:putative ABC transport system substrate-binding protein